MREHRKEPRLPEEDKVVLSFLAGDAAPSFMALTRDISPGGVRLLAGVPAPLDARVRLEIALTGSRRLFRGRGRVCWVNRLYEDSVFEMGLEFVGNDPEGIGVILQHVYGRHAV
jgi:hypothetical protein